MSNLIPITVATGDGIGPEIMGATLGVLRAVGAPLAPEFIEIGERVYRRGATSGIEPAAWESIRRTKVLLKAPITTPQGSGVKSLNVTLRKTLGLFANVRPCISYSPHVVTRHPGMDIVIIRENEEDLYAGIEHRQTQEVVQCLKLISEPGSERIVRYAFEFARNNGRRKVSCFTKDNIMKMTDGLFHRVFDASRPGVPRDQARAPHRGYRCGADRGYLRVFRCCRPPESLRGHHQRRGGSDYRLRGPCGIREHWTARGDVRSYSRVRA